MANDMIVESRKWIPFSFSSKRVLFVLIFLVILFLVIIYKYQTSAQENDLKLNKKYHFVNSTIDSLNVTKVKQNDLGFVALIFVKNYKRIHLRSIPIKYFNFCSGTVITEWFILTSAYCFEITDDNSSKLIDNASVAAGSDHNLTNLFLSSKYHWNIDFYKAHPKYAKTEFGIRFYDIGLIRIDAKFKFDDETGISSGCFLNEKIKPFDNLIVTGFRDQNSQLKKTNCDEISRKNEMVNFKWPVKLHKPYNYTFIKCKRAIVSKVDLGGPLISQRSDDSYIVGILHSIVVKSETNIVISYTPIDPVIDWIDEQVDNNLCRPKTFSIWKSIQNLYSRWYIKFLIIFVCFCCLVDCVDQIDKKKENQIDENNKNTVKNEDLPKEEYKDPGLKKPEFRSFF